MKKVVDVHASPDLFGDYQKSNFCLKTNLDKNWIFYLAKFACYLLTS